MDMNVELEQLRIKSHSLLETIRDIDAEVERAMHVAAGGTDDVGRAISIVAERHNTQLGLMFDLGKVTAQIEDLENRIREQDEGVSNTPATNGIMMCRSRRKIAWTGFVRRLKSETSTRLRMTVTPIMTVKSAC